MRIWWNSTLRLSKGSLTNQFAKILWITFIINQYPHARQLYATTDYWIRNKSVTTIVPKSSLSYNFLRPCQSWNFFFSYTLNRRANKNKTWKKFGANQLHGIRNQNEEKKRFSRCKNKIKQAECAFKICLIHKINTQKWVYGVF